jgi:hypothetical protein
MKKIKKIDSPKVDPQRGAMEKWLIETCTKLHKHLLLDFSHLKIFFRNSCDSTERGDMFVFTINYNRSYRQISLSVFPPAIEMFKDGLKDELIDGLIHEFSHVHTIPLSDAGRDRFISDKEIISLSEELTETIAQYIRRSICYKMAKDGLQINADDLKITINK